MLNLEIGKLYNNFLSERGSVDTNASKGVIGPLMHFGTALTMRYTYKIPHFLSKRISFAHR
jgi:hypothetical protein